MVDKKGGNAKGLELKEVKMEMNKQNENERFDNDPITFEKLNKDIEADMKREDLNNDIEEFGFKYSLADFMCKCFESLLPNHQNLQKKKKYFESANSILDYYMDAITFFKKMIEIDIIKYYLFTRDERRLIGIISNPDFAEIEKDRINKRIDDEYKADRFAMSNMEETLKNVLNDARNKSKTNKLFQLVQLGNMKAIFDD